MLLNHRSEFQLLVDQKLKPKLIELGFKEIILNKCIQPEVLYNKGRLWFGASWDCRDNYLEIKLGHLYWFKDVMPRVIILGNYSSYYDKIYKNPAITRIDLNIILKNLYDTLESAIKTYNLKYDLILSEFFDTSKSKYSKDFALHLGEEVLINELSKYM